MAKTGEEVMAQSVQTAWRSTLLETTWEDIQEPGAYVERGSGDLHRIPKEALIPGASPAIVKESLGASVLLRVSEDPFITTFKARLTCAQHNVEAKLLTLDSRVATTCVRHSATGCHISHAA